MSQTEVFASQAANDLEVLVSDLVAVGIPSSLWWFRREIRGRERALFPIGEEAFTASRGSHLAWCRQHDLPVINVVDDLPGTAYDDFAHLKELRAIR